MSTLKVNTIDSHSGSSLTFDSTADVVVASTTSASSNTTGALKVSGGISTQENLYVGGNAVITGTMTANGGTITLGNADTDNVSFGGEVNSDVTPDATNTYDLGSSSKKWAEVHATTLNGALTGNVTGNVTGNLTGNVTGNTSGSAGSCTGNSATAAALQTARNIGGVSFDGSANINLPGVNTSGTQNTSGNAATATALETARTIGGVSFNGSANISLPGVNTSGTQNTSGNAATATTLETARNIALSGDVSGSVSFDGSANATITATIADDSHNHTTANVDGLDTALAAKAPLASPALTGTPTAPTAVAGTDTTQVATTAFVGTAVDNLIGGAPGALDTLNELAEAINDDSSYASTITTSLGTKVDKVTGKALSANDFTDALKTKLDAIESGATADQTSEEIQDIVGGMVTGNTESGITVTYQDIDGTLDFSVASQTDQNFTNADHIKLDGIEAEATADQTGAEIKTAYEGEANTNAFTDAEKTKLSGIEASADVTDTTNVVAALTAGTNVAIAADGTISSTDTNTTYSVGDGGLSEINFTSADHTKLNGIATSANNYSLPVAATAIGGVKEGGDIAIDASGIMTVNDDSHNHVISNVDGLQAALDGKSGTGHTHSDKANLASPTFTGTPAAPTALANTNTTQIATTAFVQTEISDLIGGAPGALDTLNELAAAINDDSSYASTVTTALGGKVATSSAQALSNAANAMTISGHTITLNRGDGTTDTVTVPDNNTTYSVGDGGLTQKNFTTTLKNKLDGIASGATNVTNNNQLTNGAGYITSYVNTVDMGDGFKIANSAGTDQFTVTENEEIRFAGSGATSVAFDAATQKVTISSTDNNTTYSVGDGGLSEINFTSADHTKLNGIAPSANNYSLPTASSTVLGGVKVGSNMAIDGSGVLTTVTRFPMYKSNGSINSINIISSNNELAMFNSSGNADNIALIVV